MTKRKVDGQVDKLPYSRRQRCEQDVTRVGTDAALELGWSVEDVNKAVDRIAKAHGSREGLRYAATDETAAKYSGTTHQYRNTG